jgi:hypothetical protein
VNAGSDPSSAIYLDGVYLARPAMAFVPTNDLQASADLTAGNFQQLRGSARVSGPLVRDRVMGSVSFARGVQDGYVRDLDHPDHPSAATTSPRHAGKCAPSSVGGQVSCRRPTSTIRTGCR